MDGVKRSPEDDLTQALEEAKASFDVRRAPFEDLEPAEHAPRANNDISMVLDLSVQMTVELGRTRMSIGDLLSLHEGDVIELDVNAGDPLDLVVNGCLIARGEVVIVNDRYGIRLTDIVSPSERLRKPSR